MNILCVSYGNDSIALMQAAHEAGLRDVRVLFNDTGWADPDWFRRVEAGEAFARDCGFKPDRTGSIGMEALVRRKMAWPRQGMQFCTDELKIAPTQAWLAEHDPERVAVLYNGKRREESVGRANIPPYVLPNESAFERLTVSPLFRHTEAERDALVGRAGFEILPHRSKECSPCVNANKADIVRLSETVIAKCERIETDMGFTKSGKPKTIFRPAKHMKATGIRQIVRWANSARGKFSLDDGNGVAGCDSGMCGT